MRGWLARCVVASVLASACAAPVPVPAASATPREGGRAVVTFGTEVRQLTPILANDSITSDMVRLLYESLIRLDPTTSTPVPRLAERFSAGADAQTLTFTLRPGLLWSDGSELRADDFKFTVELLLRSRLTGRKPTFLAIVGADDFVAGRAPTVAGIEIDDRTITVRLVRPICPALTEIGGLSLLPRKVFARYLDPADVTRNADAAPENAEPPIASGPFVLGERRPDGLVLRRNDRFFLGRPLLDELLVKVVPDRAAQFASFKSGETDMFPSVALSPDEKEDLRHRRGVEFRAYPQLRFTYIGWNLLRGGAEFFQSRAVRQALAYGLNVDAVLDKLFGADAVRTFAYTPPGSWAFNGSGLNPYTYDPRRAEQLLEQEGWKKEADGVRRKDGKPFQFTLVTFAQPDTVALQQQAVQQYRQLGILVTPKLVSFSELGALLNSTKDPVYGARGGRDVDAWIIRRVLVSPDPDGAYFEWHSSQVGAGNASGYSDPTVDRALEEGRRTCGLEERRAAYHAVDLKLNEDQPNLFAFSAKAFVVVSARLKGVEATSFRGFLWNTERWWVTE